MSEERERPSRAFTVLLLVISGLFLLSGLTMAYVRDVVLDAGQFADRGASTLDDEAVRAAIANAAVNGLLDANPDLISVRPLLMSAAEFAIDTEVVEDITRLGLTELHTELLGGEADAISVRMADLLLVVNAQAQALAPDTAASLPEGFTDGLVIVSNREQVARFIEVADAVKFFAFILPLLALLIFAGFVYRSVERRGALVSVGITIGVTGVLLVVGESIGRAATNRAIDADATAAIWDAYVGDLSAWGFFVFLGGAVLALGAASLLRPVKVSAMLSWSREVAVSEPTSLWGVTVRVFVMLTIGLWLLLDPLGAVRVVVGLTGLLIIAVGLSHVINLTTDSDAATQIGESTAPRRRLAGGLTVSLAVLALVGSLGFVLVRSIGGSDTVAAGVGCNGSVLLCERSFDEVAVAATHNSMSSAEDGYFIANHTSGIVRQLDAGYRGLLIDTHYGFETDFDFVVTDRAPLTGEERDELIAELGEGAVEAAEALQARQVAVGSERGFYMCHGLCETGSTPLVEALREVTVWLERNPREVLTIFIQDEMSPEDTERAFEMAGLDDFAHAQEPGEPFPTLGEMVESNKRIFVMAENDPGDVRWYHDGFTFTEETPFDFESVADFTCDPNRGDSGSPLFQVNHFVTPPNATAAAAANEFELLFARLKQCTEERGQLPNIVAIDFFASGDVIDAVAQLNQLRRS